MDKAQLSKLLDAKVQEKLQEGYAITTYAMDAASRDRLKRELKPQAHPVHHDESTDEAWGEYLIQLEVGETASEKPQSKIAPSAPKASTENCPAPSSSSTGLWKARRH